MVTGRFVCSGSARRDGDSAIVRIRATAVAS
jgi:hypothetical protein